MVIDDIFHHHCSIPTSSLASHSSFSASTLLCHIYIQAVRNLCLLHNHNEKAIYGWFALQCVGWSRWDELSPKLAPSPNLKETSFSTSLHLTHLQSSSPSAVPRLFSFWRPTTLCSFYAWKAVRSLNRQPFRPILVQIVLQDETPYMAKPFESCLRGARSILALSSHSSVCSGLPTI